MFFQCVSLLELNAWEDDWFVAIDVLQKEKQKNKKGDKTKDEEKEVMQFVVNTPMLAKVGCKLKLLRKFWKPCKLITIILIF
jgi:hypothetical protein